MNRRRRSLSLILVSATDCWFVIWAKTPMLSVVNFHAITFDPLWESDWWSWCPAWGCDFPESDFLFLCLIILILVLTIGLSLDCSTDTRIRKFTQFDAYLLDRSGECSPSIWRSDTHRARWSPIVRLVALSCTLKAGTNCARKLGITVLYCAIASKVG